MSALFEALAPSSFVLHLRECAEVHAICIMSDLSYTLFE
jgi:hypothetical protein